MHKVVTQIYAAFAGKDQARGKGEIYKARTNLWKRKMKGQPDHRCENVPKGEVRYLSLFTGDARPEKLLVATVLQGGSASNARDNRQYFVEYRL